MLRPLFTIAARIFQKEPTSILLTVLGLALSLVVAFILWQHASYELDSDSFRKDTDRIVRAGLVMQWSDDQVAWEEAHLGINTSGLVKQISKRYGEIEEFTRILHQSNFNHDLIADHGKQITVSVDSQRVVESKIVYADANVFSFFTIPLIDGNPTSALTASNSIVLSEAKALEYFGGTQVIGRTVHLNDTILLHITGVFADLPQNTHLDFDFVISSNRIKSTYDDKLELTVGGPHCYLKLRQGVDAGNFVERMNTECNELLQTAMYNNKFRTLSLYLQPLREVPFSVNRLDVHQPESRYFLYLLQYSALIVILVGLVNYINLMISLTGFRLKEVAARKVAGANFGHILWQFLLEAALVHLIAVSFALVALITIKTPAKLLLNFYVPPLSEVHVHVWIAIMVGLVFTIFISGFYPASAFFKMNTNRLFKSARVYNAENLPSKILGVFQYSSALVMLIVAFAVTHQLYYVALKGLGIKTDQTVVIDLSLVDASPEKIVEFINRLKENKIISEYALSSSIPGDNTQTIIGLKKEASQPTNFIESNGGVDHNFIPFFGLALIAGDNFRENSSEDQVILTQGAMQRLGFSSPANAVGKHVFLEDGNRMIVAGIISDYKLKLVLKSHDNLFYEGNTGVVLTHVGRNDSRSYPTKLAVRLRKQGGSVEELRRVYETIFPDKALISYDLDSLINGQYYNYYSSRNQLIFFVLVTLLIAIIGLYAFVARKIATKTKEIGIRKILGASVTELSIFLLRGPIHQILVSILIAVPTAYFAIERYFEDFDQRVSFSWYHLIIPLIVFCLVTFIPIAVKIIRVAMENPTESIRYE